MAARAEEQEGPLDGFASIFFWIEGGEEVSRDDEDAATTSKSSATGTAVITKTAEQANESGQSTMTSSSDEDQDASISQQMLSEATSTPVRQNSTMVTSTADRVATSSEETSLPTVLTSGTSTRYVMEPTSTGEATLFDSDDETSDSKPSISTTSAAAIGLGTGLGLLVLLLGVIFVR